MTEGAWTIRARPDLDAALTERTRDNVSADVITRQFISHILKTPGLRDRHKVQAVLPYIGVIAKGLEDMGVVWHRHYTRQLKFQPLFGEDDLCYQWFVARYEHTIFSKRGGIVFEWAPGALAFQRFVGQTVNQFGSLDDALRFQSDPQEHFLEMLPDKDRWSFGYGRAARRLAEGRR